MPSRRTDPRTPAPASRQAPGGAMARAHWRLAWLLVLAMALAPMLGQMHRVVHQGSGASGASGAAGVGGAVAASHPLAKTLADEIHALFDGHGPAGCQLLDQHHGGLAGPPAALALPGLWAAQAMPCPRAAVGDGRTLAAFFDARAPPHPITAALKA